MNYPSISTSDPLQDLSRKYGCSKRNALLKVIFHQSWWKFIKSFSGAKTWGRQPTKRMLVFCLGWLVFCWFLVGFFDQPSPTTNIWGWFFGWLVHLVGFRSNFAGKPVLEPYLQKFCCFLYFIPENSRISTSQNSFVLELFQSLASSWVVWTPDSGPRIILFCLLSLYLNETS